MEITPAKSSLALKQSASKINPAPSFGTLYPAGKIISSHSPSALLEKPGVPSGDKLPIIPVRCGINWKYQFEQYGAALIVAIPLFIILSFYIFYRRGYYDLYIANKVFAGVAAILLGIVLLIGPLSRLFSFPDHYVQYRKELGIIAFFLALIHGFVSFFFLPSKFPLTGFIEKLNWPFIFGLIATMALMAIFFISNNRALNAIGKIRWWQLQYWGVRLTFIFVFLHVFIMKWGGWLDWYKSGGSKGLVHPEWPGAGLLVGWFMVVVVLMRLAEFVSPKLGRIAWYASTIVLPAIYIATFWWGRQFVK